MATRTETITALAEANIVPAPIITLVEYKAAEGITGTDNDVQLQVFVDQADRFIRTFLDQNVHATSLTKPLFKQHIDIFSGGNGRSFYPKEGPVRIVDTIEFWNGEEWEEFDTDSFTPTTDGNRVWFEEWTVFPKGRHNLRITYTYGFVGAYPDDMKRAAINLTKHYSVELAHHGIRSQSDEEQTFTYTTEVKVPVSVESLLQAYVRL